jgi:hypothetical protein
MGVSIVAVALMFLQAGGFPSVAAESGKIHVVWQDDSETNPEILYSHSNDNGTFSVPLNISRNSGISDLPRVVVHDKSVSVVWSDMSSGTYQVMLARSEDGGNIFGQAQVLSDGSAITGPPDIAWQDGRLFVVWDETNSDGDTRVIYWNSAGSRRAIGGSEGGLVPSIAVRGRRVIVAWHTDVEYKRRVHAVLSDDSGESFSKPMLLSADIQSAVNPAAAISPSGRVFVAWSASANGLPEIFLAASDTDGLNFSPPKLLSLRGREAIFPSIQVIEDDDIAIAAASRGFIVHARVSASGEPREPVRTSLASDEAGVPRVAVDNGRPIIVWKDLRGGQSQIFMFKDNAVSRLEFR